jgi:hypothetical protein
VPDPSTYPRPYHQQPSSTPETFASSSQAMHVQDYHPVHNGTPSAVELAKLQEMQDRLQGTELRFDVYLDYLHYLRDQGYCTLGGVSTSNKGSSKPKKQGNELNGRGKGKGKDKGKGKGKGEGKGKGKERAEDGISRPHHSHVPVYNRAGEVNESKLHRSYVHNLIGYHLSSSYSIALGGSVAVTGWVSDPDATTFLLGARD